MKTTQEILKKCRCCGRELTIDNFKRGRYELNNVCNDCVREHRRANKKKAKEDLERQYEEKYGAHRRLQIQDFTPRELMAELVRRGYTGNLTYTETHIVDLSTI